APPIVTSSISTSKITPAAPVIQPAAHRNPDYQIYSGMAIYSNPQSGLSTMRRLKLLICLVILAAVPAIMVSAAWAAEMVMLVQPGCPWCARFDAESAPAWPNTPEGRRAPLRRVDVTGPWPEDLAGVTPERFTPTFILM